jgi:hypothetical protein
MNIASFLNQNLCRIGSDHPECVLSAKDETGQEHLVCLAAVSREFVQQIANWEVTKEHFTQEEIDTWHTKKES